MRNNNLTPESQAVFELSVYLKAWQREGGARVQEPVKRQAPPCFTKEQTEALKQFAGVNEYYPNVWEVQQASKIFKARLADFSQGVASGEISADTAISSAAAAVWSQARRYQSEKQAAQTAATQAKPNGIKRLLRFLPIKKKGA